MPVQPIAPVLTGISISRQDWQNLAFLHWPIDPATVAGFFPKGTRPDVVDGVTYVGLVPFVMSGAGPGGRLPVPYFGRFCETNVRLYSVDDSDRHGIVFLTLDASRLATVLLARIALGLPYAWSSMRAAGAGAEPSYVSRRRWPKAANPGQPRPRCRVQVRVGPAVQPSPLEVWLTARWGLHTEVAGRTLWVPNHHGPWPLHEAELVELDDELVPACGITVDEALMLRPLWSPGVRTTFGRPRSVNSTS